MKGKSIIFSAPSGAGKTTIVRHLLGLDLGLEFSVSACSRPPRENEINGKDYHFLSVEEFREKIEQQEFVEWEEVYKDHYYGTLKSELDGIWRRDNHAIFDVDVVGGMNLKKVLKRHALSLFVSPPSLEELERRLRDRSSDTEENIRKRIAKAESEMKLAGKFDVQLVNDILEHTLQQAEVIVREFLEMPIFNRLS
jgi:guanylate kinase